MKKNTGFSLMELMTVIAIISIVAAIGIPNMIGWRSYHQLNGSARETMSFLNNARLEAVKNNATVTVTIDAGNRNLISKYTNRAEVDLGQVEKKLSLKPAINIASSTFTGNQVSFNSRGIPSESGRIVLAKSGGETRAVVMEVTGSTRIN